ncbi:threonine synthase [Ktedonosporobacter rubrisoli]|uniref:Threonine synthase n=1 Tax=Ktedonosporobacter rubrisoli TaxID=2509675 RepID=A0A4P6K3M9_KTERU|nr:threonine synthase [Ktedonosporobacter rubrisoli]QBD82096.1 threonine synthase [Ktedonosporobacter rubrisoli]
MAINSAGLQPDQESGEGKKRLNTTLSSEVVEALSSTSLRCVECSALYPTIEAGRASQLPRYRCDCGGVLDVERQFRLPEQDIKLPQDSAETFLGTDSAPSAGAAWRQLFDERASGPPIWPISTDKQLLDYSGVWRYRELILPAPENYVVSRPEGNTGLYPVGIENCGAGRAGHRQIGLYAGLERLFLKHEGENPSGSFKDRGMTVGVTMAHLLGAKAVACASTGNTSASLASYAAQAGMRGIVFLPAGNVVAGKLAQSLAYGAEVVQIKGDFDDAMELVEQVCNELGIYLLNSLNPFRVEGQKAIGFEILQQLDWQAPDWLVLPAGNLGNTSAIGKAFRQAYQLSLINHMPRIASIQAAGANPFYLSFTQNFARRESVRAHTVASAIKIGNPVSYTRARRVIEESDGIVEQVSDDEILAAKAIIDRAGIGCEPASAATLAGIRKLVARGVIKHDEQVVGVLTGNLLKDSSTGIPPVNDVVVEATMDAVRSLLSK